MITVIDSGICNLASVTMALNRVGATWTIGETPAQIAEASALLLPGVGAFADGMESLRQRDLIAPIRTQAEAGRPILGICLGMQMLAQSSEEFGSHHGLGLIRGHVRKLPQAPDFRVPNIGWCDMHLKPGATLFQGIPADSAFYFVHSYYVDCQDADDVSGWLDVGTLRAPVAVEHGAIFGAQFHPEKSQDVGLAMLANFVSVVARAVGAPE